MLVLAMNENMLEESVVHNMWAITGFLHLFWYIISEPSVMKNIWKENERGRGVAFFKSFLTEHTGYFADISLKIKFHLSRDICKDQIYKYSSICQWNKKGMAFYEITMQVSLWHSLGSDKCIVIATASGSLFLTTI